MFSIHGIKIKYIVLPSVMLVYVIDQHHIRYLEGGDTVRLIFVG